MINLVLRRRTPSYVDARHGRTWVLRRRKTVWEVLRRRRTVLRQRTTTPEKWYNVWWCIFRQEMQFPHVYKILSGNNTQLGFKCCGDCFLPFHTILIRVGYHFNINKPINVSDNRNQLSMSNQILISKKTLLPWMCEIWKMLIIAKYVCEIKTDHQTDNHFLFPTIVLTKATKLDHPKLAFW